MDVLVKTIVLPFIGVLPREAALDNLTVEFLCTHNNIIIDMGSQNSIEGLLQHFLLVDGDAPPHRTRKV